MQRQFLWEYVTRQCVCSSQAAAAVQVPKTDGLAARAYEAVWVTSSGIAKGRELAEARLVVGVMAGLYRAGPLSDGS